MLLKGAGRARKVIGDAAAAGRTVGAWTGPEITVGQRPRFLTSLLSASSTRRADSLARATRQHAGHRAAGNGQGLTGNSWARCFSVAGTSRHGVPLVMRDQSLPALSLLGQQLFRSTRRLTRQSSEGRWPCILNNELGAVPCGSHARCGGRGRQVKANATTGVGTRPAGA